MKREIKTTLAIDGEKQFKSALSDAARNMRILASEGRATTSAFEGNADSIDKLIAKNNNLSKKITQQEEIVRALNQAVQDSAEKYGEADKKTDGYRIKLNNATTALNKMSTELNDNSDAISKLNNETKSAKMDKFANSLKNVGKISGKSFVTGLKAASAAAAALGAAVIGVGMKIANLTEETREYRMDVSKLKQNAQDAGLGFGTMKAQLGSLTALTGEADSSIEALSNLMATGFDETQMTKAVDALSGAVVRFPDTLKIEGLADGLQETLATGAATGQFGELIERMGGNLEEFNQQLSNATTEADKQQVALSWLASSGLPAVNQEYRSVNKEMLSAAEAQFQLNDSMASLATAAEPTIAKLKGGFANVLTSLIDMMNGSEGASGAFGENIKTLADTAISQMKAILPAVSQFISSFVGAIVEALPSMLPVLFDGVFSLISGVLDAVVENAKPIGEMVTKLIRSIVEFLIASLPLILSAGIQIITSLISGIASALPKLIPAIIQGIMAMIQAIIDNLPLILDAGIKLILGLLEGIIGAIPVIVEALPQLIDSIITFVLEAIPQIIEAGISLFIALVEALPTIIEAIVSAIPMIIDNVIDAVINALPLIIDAGIKLFVSLIEALPKIIITIVKALPKIISSVLKALIDNIDKFIMAGVQLFVAIIENIPAIIMGIIKAIPQIIKGIVESIGSFVGEMGKAGLNLIKGLWQGISDAASWIWGKIKGFFSGIVDGIKNFFGIHSPSDLFADEIGGNMAKGVGVGFVDQMKKVSNEMKHAIPSSLDALDVNTSYTKYRASGTNAGKTREIIRDSGFQPQFNGPVYINNDMDIKTLAQKLGYEYKRAIAAQGA